MDIATRLAPAGIDFNPLQPIDLLLVIDAFWVSGEPYSVGNLWKRWLTQHAAGSSIAVLGWREQQPSPYGSLLSCHKTALKELAMPVGQLQPHSLPIDGVDARRSMKTLTEGHGQNSLLKALTSLRSPVDTALFLAEESDDWNAVWEMQKASISAAVHTLQPQFEQAIPKLQPTPLCTWLPEAQEQLRLLEEILHKDAAPPMSHIAGAWQVLGKGAQALSSWQQWLQDEVD